MKSLPLDRVSEKTGAIGKIRPSFYDTCYEDSSRIWCEKPIHDLKQYRQMGSPSPKPVKFSRELSSRKEEIPFQEELISIVVLSRCRLANGSTEGQIQREESTPKLVLLRDFVKGGRAEVPPLRLLPIGAE